MKYILTNLTVTLWNLSKVDTPWSYSIFIRPIVNPQEDSFSESFSKISIYNTALSKGTLCTDKEEKVFFRKKCSKNMQQIYRSTQMLMCHFNKVALHSCIFTAYFQNILSEHLLKGCFWRHLFFSCNKRNFPR